MKIIKLVCYATILALTLSACSSFSTRDQAYLSAQNVPPLKIPPGVSGHAFQAYYPVSDKTYAHAPRDIGLTPPGLNE